MTRIAVLGGGPAGGSAALALARGGAAVDLYLPARPGEKPCGGAVPEHVLPRSPASIPRRCRPSSAPRPCWRTPAGSRLTLDLAGIRIFRRRDLDRAIVEAAAGRGRGAAAGQGRGAGSGGEGDPGLRRRRGAHLRLDRGRGRRPRALPALARADAPGGQRRPRRLPLRARLATASSSPSPRSRTPISGSSRARTAPRSASPTRRAGSRTAPRGPRSTASSTAICRRAGGTCPGRATAIRSRSSGRGPCEAVRRGARPPHPADGGRGGGRRSADPRGDPLRPAHRPLGGREPARRDGPMAYPERLESELEGEMERAARARDLFFEGAIGRWMVPVARAPPGDPPGPRRPARLPAALSGLAAAAAAGGGGK